MSTLLIVEHDHQHIHPSTQHLLSAALQFGAEPLLLVAGSDCEGAVQEAAMLAGVKNVLAVDDSSFAQPFPENITALVLSLLAENNPWHICEIIAPATTFGKNILPRLAAKLNQIQVSEVIKIIDKKTFEHPIYAGNALETIEVLDPIKILTIRASAFERVEAKQAACPIERINKSFPAKGVEFVKQLSTPLTRPDLGNAAIVVAGGRGLQKAENFKLLEELADALGAAIGASRAAVDAGFVSNDLQVGQTGKVVAPSLYIAVGISGAIQHLAGMRESKVIVAINKDPDAPIFQIASYGLVGDLFDIVPALIQELKQRKNMS